MNILFISRKYPPSVGGMENYAYNLCHEFSKRHNVFKITLGKKQIHLFWFFPLAFLKGLYILLKHKISCVYIGDTVISPIGLFFQKVLKSNVIITIYGLDVTYDKFKYQTFVNYFLPKMDKIVAISEATKEQAIKRNVDPERINVIPIGVNREKLSINDFQKNRELISKKFNINILENNTILFTIGRLVKRKGIAWFVENVFEKLNSSYIYLIAGEGEEKNIIKQIIENKKLENRVYLLGSVDDRTKSILFAASDIFISPNIKVNNDMEGFGIVNIEAGIYGVPTVASNIDGIPDAIIDGESGVLVDAENPKAFVDGIYKAQNIDRKHVGEIVQKHFSWENVYKQYLEII